MNKPNGQFVLESDAQTIKQFMSTLNVRKIPGTFSPLHFDGNFKEYVMFRNRSGDSADFKRNRDRNMR